MEKIKFVDPQSDTPATTKLRERMAAGCTCELMRWPDSSGQLQGLAVPVQQITTDFKGRRVLHALMPVLIANPTCPVHFPEEA